MTIGEYLKITDIDTYRRLMKIGKRKHKKHRKKNEIELGDRVENLMRHDAYKRVGGRLKQVKWSD